MRSRKMLFLFSFMFLLGLLAGCNSSEKSAEQSTKTEGLDELKEIQVISREEGSGTRSAFAELSGFLKNEEGKTDLTTDRAQFAEDAGQVCEMVAENPSAIGYLSLAGVPEDGSVKVLKVDGLKADFSEKSYPLGRTFYLTYSGQLNELEEDFLTYIHGKGQEIVERSYVPVAKSSTFLSNQAEGRIRIGGSTSVKPLIMELAENYMAFNPNAEILVESSDSGDGLTRTMSGELDFGMASRDLKDYEMELLDYEAIAKDDIAVIVNPDNPLEDLTTDDLKKIFTGEYLRWDELNQ